MNSAKTLPVLAACFNQFNSFALDHDPGIDSEDQEAARRFVKMISENWGCKVCAHNGGPIPSRQIETVGAAGHSGSGSQRSPVLCLSGIAKEVFGHGDSFGAVTYSEASS